MRKADRGGLVASVNDQIKRSTSATSDLVGGMAEAVAEGFRSYNDTVTTDNVMVLGVNNGFIAGTVAGYARFFEKLAETARTVLDDISRPQDGGGPNMYAGPDPATMAKQIADHLRSDPSFIDAVAARVQAKATK